MIVLWVIFWLLIVAIIILAIIVRLPPKKVTTGTYVPSCEKPLEDLPQVTNARFETCQTLEGYDDPQRFYDTHNNWTILPLDPAVIPSAGQICIQYCSQTELSQNSCITRDEDYNDCVDKLAPIECSDPAVPVARNGTVMYYTIGRGRVSCY